MSADDIFDKAASAAFARLGTAAVFQPESGAPVGLQVELVRDQQLQPADTSAQIWATGITIEYILADLGREANRGETFTVGAVTWTVREVVANDGQFCMVVVK